MAAAPAAAAVVGGFSFGAVVVGQQLSPNQVFYSSPGPATLHASGNTVLAGGEVHPTHTKSIRFPGWAGLAAGSTVDASASMLSTDSGFASDAQIGGSDGMSTALDPEDQNYAVSAWIKPDRASDYPIAADEIPSDISPNIVQKGVSTPTGSFWKMSLGMTGTGTAARWYPFCVFKNGGSQLNPGQDLADRFKLEPNTAYKIECLKSGATATLRVTRVLADGPATVVTHSEGIDFAISNGNAISVGKKPRSTNPADSYAGTLDDLIINKG